MSESVNPILDAIKDAAPAIAAESAACERAGRLTAPVVDAMRAAGVFRMTWSRTAGGPELDPLAQVDVLEALAAADGSAGWCGMINSDGGYVGAFLEPSVVAELYPSLDLPTSVIAAPSGRAIAEGDGYRVTGRWGFGSGSTHCAWFFLGCLVYDGDALRIGSDGNPVTRLVAVPASDVTILDTWHTTGLNATASNDLTVTDTFVPMSHGFDLFGADPIDPSPLYSWRWNFFINLSGVPLGVARAALANARQVAETKISLPAMTPLREEATVQSNFARATALVDSSRAYVHDAIGAAWEAMQIGGAPSPEEWYTVRLATTHAMHSCKEAVNLLYEALGTTGVYRSSVLDRQYRDITTMSQHLVTQTKTYAAAGRGLLGIDPAAIAF